MTTQTAHSDAAVLDTIREVVGNASAGKVFGTPVSQGGLTVLPVAKVSGGGGGGGEHDSGTGGGLGLTARPLGVFVLKDGKVHWRPALDLNKVILGGQLVAITALLTLRAIMKARR